MSKIFTKEDKEKARKLKRPWHTPLFASLVLDNSRVKHTFKKQIEKWFENLPDSEKVHFLSRFKSKNDREHLSAFFELMWNQFFYEEKWKITPHPSISGVSGKVDFFIENTKQDFYFEVVTVFQDLEREKREKLIDELLNKINEIKHYFFISIYIKDWLPDKFKISRVKSFIKSELDKLDPKQDIGIKQVIYSSNNYKIRFDISGKKMLRKDSIIGAYMGPGFSGPVGSKQIRNRIEEKIKKYKSIEKRGCPFVIALCSGEDWTVNEENLDYELFGKPVLVWNNNKPNSSRFVRDNTGLFKAHHKLSAAIFCKRELRKIQNGYGIVYRMKLFHNPYAINPLKEDVFYFLPQLVLRGNRMETINDDPRKVIIFY